MAKTAPTSGIFRKNVLNKIMEEKLICGDKFKYAHKTIALPVELKDLPNNLKIEDTDLVLKSSFHVSLVCIGEIMRKHNVLIADFEDKVINDFCEFVQNNTVNIESYSNDFKFCAKDDKKAVIVLCKVENLGKFFDFMNHKYKLNIEYPPTHVTLYTLPSRNGIFLTDTNDLKDFTKPIPNPINRIL